METNFKDIMIDIETMGTKPGCAILSIAAAEFDIETGSITREFYETISMGSCEYYGLTFSSDTIRWWLSQSEDARKKINLSAEPRMDDVLRAFARFIPRVSVQFPNKPMMEVRVWANSPSFDCRILEAAYNKINSGLPWRYWEERDVRTLLSLCPGIKDTILFTGTAHCASDDCRHQVKLVSAAWRAINGDNHPDNNANGVVVCEKCGGQK